MSVSNENARLETFCDGVIAIAITLLILEIKVPPIHDIHSIRDVWHILGEHWPSYFAFVLSFIIILIGWVGHHALFKVLDKTSPQFLYANGFFLLTLVVLPFPTAFVAEYINTPYAQPAITVFCFSSLFNSIGWNVLFLATTRPKDLTKNEENLQKLQFLKKQVVPGLFIYSIIFLLSFFFPVTAFCLNTFSWLIWLVMGIAWSNKV